MSKKILLALCLLSLNNIACASQGDNSIEDVPGSISDIQPRETPGSTVGRSERGLTSNVAVPYRYQTEADVKQTLGYLRSTTKSASNDTSSASDISPQEDLVSPEPTQPKPPAKIKKTAKKIQKPAAKKVIKPEQSISSTVHTGTTTTIPTPAIKQDNPATVNEELPSTPKNNQPAAATAPISTSTVTTGAPIAPTTVTNEPLTTAKPVENFDIKGASGIGDEHITIPIQPDTTVAPQKPIQPNSTTDAAPEVSTILEFNQSDVDLSSSHKAALLEIANKLKGQSNFILRLQSYGSVVSSDLAEARRLSLQRAIKVRKFLIENEMNPNNISVNAIEDGINKSNKIEIRIEKNS